MEQGRKPPSWHRAYWLLLTVGFVSCLAAVALAVVRTPRILLVVNDPPESESGATGGGAPAAEGASLPAPAHPVAMNAADRAAYDAKLLAIANLPPPKPAARAALAASSGTVRAATGSATTGTAVASATGAAVDTTAPPKPQLWPVKAAYPDAGALLPFNRIVAYYGNFYSTQMGVLGEYPEDQVIRMLASTSAMWAAADPSTPVIPAIDYIAVSAQASAGTDGTYRLRMPSNQIDKAIDMANQLHGIVFLDIQVGLSTVEREIPPLAAYLSMPNVELSLDPEFAMHNGARPGTVIGSMDAKDINWAAQYLADLVRKNNLPPKILVVHRFTEPMVTNARAITPLPEVQIVMDMDGFGPPAQKLRTYKDFIIPEPVQFTGFKLFYKNDIRVPGSHLMTPQELLRLSPQPSYIQYQ